MKKISIMMLVITISFMMFACSNETIEEPENDTILYPEAAVEFIDTDGTATTLTLEEILELDQVDFTATKDTSSAGPVDNDYTGVLLRDVLEKLNMSLDGITGVMISAEDGYKVSIEADKVKQDDNIYLTFKKEGKWLENKDNGGEGPLQTIITKDQFSQYWCKYVVSVELLK